MSAVDLRSDALHVGRLHVRGPAEESRARSRFEAAAADLSPRGLGLPPRCVLVVRRVAPAAPLALASGAPSGELARAMETELRAFASRARRPWLHPDALRAEAVLFADEAELAACLLRDWLRGTVGEPWWWRSLLGETRAHEWLAARVIARGDVVVPVLALLSGRGEAVAWVRGMSAREAETATTAAARAFALSWLDFTVPRVTTRGASEAAVRMLHRAVPELLAEPLTVPQRRLLAVALAIDRVPGWARSTALVEALAVLEPDPPARTGHAVSAAYGVAPPPASAPAELSAVPRVSPRADTKATSPRAAPAAPEAGTPGVAAGIERPVAPQTRATTRPTASASSDSAIPFGGTPAARLGRSGSSAQVDQHTGTAPPPRSGRLITIERGSGIAPSDQSAETLRTRASVPAMPTAELAPCSAAGSLAPTRTPTAFGGIFYLLNAALALELYGDFARPRTRGIELLPWDWLALTGRAWFGDEFADDPVWEVLASLAGRDPGDAPGRYFRAPREWRVPAEWLTAWGPVDEVTVRATRARLRVLHPAGFPICDVARTDGSPAFAEAGEICLRYRELRAASPRHAPRDARDRAPAGALARWLGSLLDFLVARLSLALGEDERRRVTSLVCRHPAEIECSPSAVDVHLSLADLPLAIRIAGLDRDAGWIPAAGRSLSFHFS